MNVGLLILNLGVSVNARRDIKKAAGHLAELSILKLQVSALSIDEGTEVIVSHDI